MKRIARVMAAQVLCSSFLGGCGGSPTEPSPPPPIPIQTDRIALTASRSCFLEQAGTIQCWGGGKPLVRLNPPNEGSRFVALRGGSGQFCALTADSTAYCWGTNRYGELGDGTQTDRDQPTRVQGGHKFVAISAGGFSTCALDSVGQAFCWGRNNMGQLGLGVRGEDKGALIPTAVVTDLRWVALQGSGANCSLREDGSAYCWGARIGSLDPDNVLILPGDCQSVYYMWYQGKQCLVPTAVQGPTTFVQLAGDRCGLTVAGQAYCWGDGTYGAFGNGESWTYSVAAVAVAGDHQFRVITAGVAFSCALDQAGKAWCWGDNFVGQLGIGEDGRLNQPSQRSVPTAVLTNETFVAIASQGGHTCALTPAETVWCWGANDQGQLGPTAPANHSTVPVQVILP